MSIQPPSQPRIAAALISLRGPTMADVLDRLASVPGLEGSRRDGLRSAVRTFCRGLGKAPLDVSAEPRAVREALAGLSPGGLGISSRSFRNLRSLVAKALAAAGIETIGVRPRTRLSPAWEPLVARLTGKTMRCALMRPLRLLSDAGIEPHQVDQGVADELGRALEARQVLRHPRTVFTTFVRQWNQACRIVPGWPEVTLRIDDRRDYYVLPPETFPPGLGHDIAGWLQAISSFSLSRRRPSLRPCTVAGHRTRLWELASAAVHAGVPAQDLASSNDLTRAPTVERALEWLADHRFGGQPAPHLGSIARVAYLIARELMEDASSDQRQTEERNLAELKLFCQNLKHTQIGLAPKNRALLNRFKDPDLLARFVTLPGRVFREILGKRRIKVADAVRGQIALAIEILLHAPVRIQNLRTIDLDAHYKVYGNGPKARVVLEFPAAEVKNAVDLSYPLPAEAAALVAVYRERLRPLVAAPGNSYLFSGDGPRAKQASLLSTQIANLTFELVGVRATAHQFRHICSLLYLQQHPGDYETVRQFLGQKRIETTIRFYAGMEGEAAIALWDDTLAQIRRLAAERLNGPRRRR